MSCHSGKMAISLFLANGSTDGDATAKQTALQVAVV
jgi:hypothetical protein